MMVLPKINPIKTKSWLKLTSHYQSMKKTHMRDLFMEDPKRFSDFSLMFEDMLVDFSKNIITHETLKLFLELAEEVNLNDAIRKCSPAIKSMKLNPGPCSIRHSETDQISQS